MCLRPTPHHPRVRAFHSQKKSGSSRRSREEDSIIVWKIAGLVLSREPMLGRTASIGKTSLGCLPKRLLAWPGLT